MPGVELETPLGHSGFDKCASLTAHKVLPRRRIPLDNKGDLLAGGETFKNRAKIAGDTGVQSWNTAFITPKAQRNLRRYLPLTPPSLTVENFEHNLFAKSGDTDEFTPPIQSHRESTPGTPANIHSPPTPDSTPPRKHLKKNELSMTVPSLHSSSRAESFRTAREQLSSDDEDEPPLPSPSKFLTLRTPNALEKPRVKGIGLGLALESDSEDRTSTTITPRKLPTSDDFKTFDGNWSYEGDEMKEGLVPAVGVTAVSFDSPDAQGLQPREKMFGEISPSGDNSPIHIRRGPSPQDRIHIIRNSPPSGSTERFAEKIEWPLEDDASELDAKIRQVDNRRLSQMSTTSAVVEAIVVDTLPQRRQTLRHTSKNSSLRTASSPNNGSNRSSLVSNGPKHRLTHRKAKITERGHCSSLTSDDAVSAVSELVLLEKESLPRALIPERQSSLKSSAAHPKRRHKINYSLAVDGQDHGRPVTAPDATTGYFEMSRRKPRPVSDSVAIQTVSGSHESRSREVPLMVPTRSSSLSAPTSRNISRTASITSKSQQAQALELKQLEPLPAAPQLPFQSLPRVEFTRVESPRVDQHEETPANEEWLAVHDRSLLATPFSIRSINSSTPGVLEVKEATAINIYPHNNHSVVIVQQRPRRSSERTTPTKREPDIIVSQEPEGHRLSRSRLQIDSPLRYPRDPPLPPAFNVIPPTPAYNTPRDEANRQLGPEHPPNPSRFSIVQRALSARRYSESFVAPITKTFTRRANSQCRTTLPAAPPADKLSPFWRPRGFWDEFSDSDSEFGNAIPPAPRRSASRSASLTRRLGSLRLRPRLLRVATGRRRSVESALSYQFVHAERKKSGEVPRGGYQVQFLGIRGLAAKLERRKERKEGERREKERARIRESIGGVALQHRGPRLGGGEPEWVVGDWDRYRTQRAMNYDTNAQMYGRMR